MAGKSKTRAVNGAVSACIAVFFVVHASIGSVMGFVPLSTNFAWAVWLGVGLAAAHVVLCVATSVQQLTDAVRPPSIHKKRHLALKWATGAALFAVAAAHVVVARTAGAHDMLADISGVAVIVALATALAVHLCVGSKSLLKDLNISRSYRTAVRAAACAFAVVFAVAALAGFAIR
ncbi:MAG: hypothetical protein Q4C41_07195 [Eggerthellaceae bacterium]|nr:hypothetical protein [Eggerthellaceae bacterium]